MQQKIQVEVSVQAPLQKTWDYFTQPAHITKWNFASSDWQCPSATNDLRVGGAFSSRMEAKDGSFGFDFAGTYTEVTLLKSFSYTMGEGEGARTATVTFTEENGTTTVTTVFDAESQNSIEQQKNGWQAILENFKKHVEAA